jgi:hypothetical protein
MKSQNDFFCFGSFQTVEEETQKAREDVKRAIKQRLKQAEVPEPERGGGDFDAMFGSNTEPSAAAQQQQQQQQHAGARPTASPAKAAVAAAGVERSTSAQRQMPNASDGRSLSAKRADGRQQLRPSSAKGSSKPAAAASSSSSASARPASAPAASRAAAAAAAVATVDELGLDASASAPPDLPVNASQVAVNRTFSRHISSLLSHTPRPFPFSSLKRACGN